MCFRVVGSDAHGCEMCLSECVRTLSSIVVASIIFGKSICILSALQNQLKRLLPALRALRQFLCSPFAACIGRVFLNPMTETRRLQTLRIVSMACIFYSCEFASLLALGRSRAARCRSRGMLFVCARALKGKNRGGVFRHRNYSFLLNFKHEVSISVPDFSTAFFYILCKILCFFYAWDFALADSSSFFS